MIRKLIKYVFDKYILPWFLEYLANNLVDKIFVREIYGDDFYVIGRNIEKGFFIQSVYALTKKVEQLEAEKEEIKKKLSEVN